jgi:hypothetical protein
MTKQQTFCVEETFGDGNVSNRDCIDMSFEIKIKFEYVTADLREVAVSLNVVIKHRALHEKRVVAFEDALDAFFVS